MVAIGYNQIKLIGVGKTQHINNLSNWTNSNDVSVCADESNNGNTIWSNWGASQRDLFVLNHEGNIELYQNISSGLPDSLEQILINLIDSIPEDNECIDGEVNNENPCMPMECWDGEWQTIIIDCQEQMGVPCDGGIYIEPPNDVCCSSCVQYGDSNEDGILNVIDAVEMVNLIINSNYNEVSDINNDNYINVIDIVLLIDLILG